MSQPEENNEPALGLHDREVVRIEHNSIDMKTDRIMVPGGWLYRTSVHGGSSAGPIGVATTFVPDEDA